MKPDRRVLVVGTTVDYIDWIRRACPGRALFITDTGVRSREEAPLLESGEEVVCDLSRPDLVREMLASHLGRRHMAVDGVVCFDCDSLLPAARLAADLSLDFPSPAAVMTCRDKLTSKQIWRENGIACPAVAAVRQADEAVAFLSGLKAPCVLKPVFGSGSELVFRCRTGQECRRAFADIDQAFRRRANKRLDPDPEEASVIIEACLEAPEFSCDFFLEKGAVGIIRLTRKIPAPRAAFGTTRAYLLIDSLPGCDLSLLKRGLARAAGLLGLERAVCMADFMVHDGEIYFLEITPRPGGDCLPSLVRRALNLDTIILALDLAQGRPVDIGSFTPPRTMAGLRVHAEKGGALKRIDWAALADDPRVEKIIARRQPGHNIFLPPEDYDTFLLGNIIFSPRHESTLVEECDELLARLNVEIYPHDNVAEKQ